MNGRRAVLVLSKLRDDDVVTLPTFPKVEPPIRMVAKIGQ